MSTWFVNKIIAWLLRDAKRMGNFAASQAAQAQVQVDGISAQLKLTGAWDPEQLAVLRSRIQLQRARLAAAKSLMTWLSMEPDAPAQPAAAPAPAPAPAPALLATPDPAPVPAAPAAPVILSVDGHSPMQMAPAPDPAPRTNA